MQYLLSEKEMADAKKAKRDLEIKVQELVGELAEAKGVRGCPMIGQSTHEYPCCDCPMDNRCDYNFKTSYLPK